MDEEVKEAIETEVSPDAETEAQTEAPSMETNDSEVTVETDTAAEESIGNIKISVEVVSTIAGIAASEIEGVSCMYTSFVDGVVQRLGAKKNTSKGVKVDMGSDSVGIDLYIIVEYGVKIPELAWSIQENVKTNVETMTGLSVSKVNIHIEGISFKKEADSDELDAITE